MNYRRKLSYKGPYHVCVCFNGVLNNTCVVSHRASVPAAVQLDQGMTAVVARESTICKSGTLLSLNRPHQIHKYK